MSEQKGNSRWRWLWSNWRDCALSNRKSSASGGAQWRPTCNSEVNSGDPGAYWQMLSQKHTVDHKRIEIASRIAELIDRGATVEE